MEKFVSELKIPKERIAVLIGTNGEIKRKIEAETGAKLKIDSEEGDVFIRGSDGLSIYSAKEITKAIARGFNPSYALLLLKQDYVLEIITLSEELKTSKKNITRIKSRVIGTDGKVRKNLEEITETHISIYGKTISIIGEIEKVKLCKQAIRLIISGSPHSSVYKWLNKKKKELVAREFIK